MYNLAFQSAKIKQEVSSFISKLSDVSNSDVLSYELDDNEDGFTVDIYMNNGDTILIKYLRSGPASVSLNSEVVYNESNSPIDYVISFLNIIPKIYKDYISSNGDLDVNESMQPDSTTYPV